MSAREHAQRVTIVAALAALALSCGGSGVTTAPRAAVRTSTTAPDLARLAGTRVFFAHQSVGQNIVDGARGALGSEAPIAIVEGAAGVPAAGGVLVSERVGNNGDPRSKLAAFESALRGGLARQVRWAGLKFCYTDFDGVSDVRPLFDQYVATIDRLKREFPDVRFFHVTVPLTTVEPRPLAWIKDLLKRPSARTRNARREEFSRLLRETYGATDPVFDLERAESAAGDRPALAPEYSADGGHLNATGRDVVGRRFLAFLGSLP